MSLLNDAPSCAGSPSVNPFPGTGSEAFKKEKASWYREVLDVEPGSKIFLPYSRLLSEIGESEEAVRVLRNGLVQHPEFTEARLFLINLLHQQGESAQCGAEVARLAGLFCEYPDFWDAWSNFVAEQGDKEDFAVSLGILGALIRDKNISLVDVLSSGLNTLRAKYGASGGSAGGDSDSRLVTALPAKATPEKDSPLPQIPDHDLADSLFSEAAEQEVRDTALEAGFEGADTVPFVFGENGDIALDVPRDTLPLPISSSGENAAPSLAAGSPGEEKCSLRTRSMAEVLAEQGDIRGAIDIYEELLASVSSEDAEELYMRLESLKGRLGNEGIAHIRHASASSQPKAVTTQPGTGVLDLLERLAVRLETKARQ